MQLQWPSKVCVNESANVPRVSGALNSRPVHFGLRWSSPSNPALQEAARRTQPRGPVPIAQDHGENLAQGGTRSGYATTAAFESARQRKCRSSYGSPELKTYSLSIAIVIPEPSTNAKAARRTQARWALTHALHDLQAGPAH